MSESHIFRGFRQNELTTNSFKDAATEQGLASDDQLWKQTLASVSHMSATHNVHTFCVIVK